MKKTIRIIVIILASIGLVYSLCHIFLWKKENDENKIGMLSDLKDVKDSQPEAKYCIEKIKIKLMK